MGHPYLSTLNRVYKKYSFLGMGEGVSGNKMLILYTFNILAHFSIIFIVANYPFEKCWCVQFFRGRGVWEIVYFVHSFNCWQLWMAPNYFGGWNCLKCKIFFLYMYYLGGWNCFNCKIFLPSLPSYTHVIRLPVLSRRK